jgi:hypothetical protein
MADEMIAFLQTKGAVTMTAVPNIAVYASMPEPPSPRPRFHISLEAFYAVHPPL